MAVGMWFGCNGLQKGPSDGSLLTWQQTLKLHKINRFLYLLNKYEVPEKYSAH
jgi:hypothetical protein